MLGRRETQVPELARNTGVQQGPRALRPVRGAQRLARARLCAGDRGLHGRGGAGAARLPERRGHAGHCLHPRPRAEAVPLHRRGGLQLRRRRRRPARRAQGPRRRPALRHRRAQRSSSCSCRRSTTRTATSASSAPTAFARYVSEAMPLSAASWSSGRAKAATSPPPRAGPHGQQRRAAVEGAARRRPEAPGAGEIARSGRSSDRTSAGNSGDAAPRRLAGQVTAPHAASRGQERRTAGESTAAATPDRQPPAALAGRAIAARCCVETRGWDRPFSTRIHALLVRTARRARRAFRLARQPAPRARRASHGPPCDEGLRGQPFEALAARLIEADSSTVVGPALDGRRHRMQRRPARSCSTPCSTRSPRTSRKPRSRRRATLRDLLGTYEPAASTPLKRAVELPHRLKKLCDNGIM